MKLLPLKLAPGRIRGANIITEDGSATICTMANWTDGDDFEELAAYAHALTAAPELLASCKQFIAWLEDGTLVRDISRDASPKCAGKMLEFVHQLNLAQAAVAKAESVEVPA